MPQMATPAASITGAENGRREMTDGKRYLKSGTGAAAKAISTIASPNKHGRSCEKKNLAAIHSNCGFFGFPLGMQARPIRAAIKRALTSEARLSSGERRAASAPDLSSFSDRAKDIIDECFPEPTASYALRRIGRLGSACV